MSVYKILQKSAAFFNDALQKSKKDLLNMAGPEHQDKALWVNEHIAHPPMQTWFLKHVIQDPSKFNDQNKETMKHFGGIAGIVPAIRDMQLKNVDFDSAVNQMKSHEKEHFDKQGNLIPVEGEKILDLGNGWSWYDLKKPVCRVHGNAMGHCGNMGGPHGKDTILSLQKIHKFGGKELAEPAVTFINRSGYLTETKGKQNDKPHKKYHKAIVELLKHKKDIVANIGGGYKPENNFNIDQLDPFLKQELKSARPDFMDSLSTDPKDRNQLKIKHEQKMKYLGFNEYQRAAVFADDATIKQMVRKDPTESAQYLSGRLDQDDVNHIYERGDKQLSAALLGHRYTDKQIDDFVNEYTHYATTLPHKRLNINHVNKIVEKNPGYAAKHLKDHPLLNADHINKIIEAAAVSDIDHLKDHPLFSADHIDKIVEKNPGSAAKHLNKHPAFSIDHINEIAEKNPSACAAYLKDHPLFNPDHINKIIEKDPNTAALFLNKHPLLNADHISKIMKDSPLAAARYLNKHPLLNADHINKIIEKDPYFSIEYLKDHPLFNADHINKIIEKDPKAAAKYLNEHPIYNQIMAERGGIKEKKTASEQSVYSLLQKSERLMKADGQYNKIDPGILNAENSEYVLSPALRAKLGKQVSSGKISPKDMEKLLSNRNFQVAEALSKRSDLTEDQVKKLVDGDSFMYERGNVNKKNEVRDLYSDVFKQLKQHRAGEATNDFVKSGSHRGIDRFLLHGDANASHLFDIVTQRHDLPSYVFDRVFNHDEYGPEHAAEIIHHPDPEVVVKGIKKLDDERITPALLQAALNKNNNAITEGLINARSPFSKAQVRGLIDHPVKSIAINSMALARNHPEIVQHIVDNIDHYGKVSEVLPADKDKFRYRDTQESILDNLISETHSHSGNHKITPEQASKILDYAIDNNHHVLNNESLYEKEHNQDVIKKLLSTNNEDAKRLAIKYSPSLSQENAHTAISNTSDPETLGEISKRGELSPDHLREIWAKMPEENRSNYYFLRDLLGHKSAPTEVLNSAESYIQKAGPDKANTLTSVLSKNPNAGAGLVDRLLSSPDADIRLKAANNSNATPEQIKKGITDKDKTVREAWFMHPGVNADHLRIGLKDRAPSIRQNIIAKHKNMTGELLHEMITKDKSEDVRKEAIVHENVLPETIDHALMNDTSAEIQNKALGHRSVSQDTINRAIDKNPTPELASKLIERDDSLYSQDLISGKQDAKRSLSQDQITKLFNPVFRDMKQAIADYDADYKNYDARSRRNVLSGLAHDLARHPNAPQEVWDQLFDSLPIQAKATLLEHDIRHTQETPGHVKKSGDKHLLSLWDQYQNDLNSGNDEKERAARSSFFAIVEHPDAERLGIIDKVIDKGTAEAHERVLGNKNLSIDRINKIAAKTDDSDVMYKATIHPNHNIDTVNTILDNKAYWDNHEKGFITQSKFFNEDHANRLFSSDNFRARLAAINSSVAPESMIIKALKDPDEEVRSAAGKSIAHHKPDMYNQSLEGSHDVEIHPATEKLKHLKGLVEEAGGKIHKKDLGNIGFQGIPGQLLDGTGHVTPQSIENYLGSMPKARFNVSYGKWTGAQMHDPEQTQNVYRINMTDDHAKQLKEQGLFDTFKWLHNLTFRGGHPVDRHTIGWIRADESHPGHTFYDEIQSDLGQGTIRQIEQLKEKGRMNPEEADKKAGDLKKIIKIFSGPFKTINHALFGAAHEISRQKGITSTSMDTLNDQAKQSGMNLDKQLPGHMHHTYSQLPEEAGYKNKGKKDVMPNTNAPESEVQYRKLVKAMDFINFLRKKI